MLYLYDIYNKNLHIVITVNSMQDLLWVCVVSLICVAFEIGYRSFEVDITKDQLRCLRLFLRHCGV